MAIDFTLPTKLQNYDTGVLQTLRDHQSALAAMLDPAFGGMGYTNLVTGHKRLNTSTSVFEFWNGTTWQEVGMAYLKSSVAASTYAPLASPNFSGTPTVAGATVWTSSNLQFSSPTTFGSLALAGSNTGWAGIQFTAGTKKYTLMVDPTAGVSGIYSVTDAAWKWYFDASGSLNVGTVPWALVTGKPSAVSYFSNDAGYYNAWSSPSFTVVVAGSSGGAGQVTMRNGGASNTGYIEFVAPAAYGANRQGYIGYSASTGGTDGGTLSYVAGRHSFIGSVQSNGQLYGNGSASGFGAITLTTSTSTPTGGNAGDFVFGY